MRLAEVRAEEKVLSIAFGAGDLKVGYRPAGYTAARADELQEAFNDPSTQSGAFLDMIAEVIASWDLEDDDGTPIPIDPDVWREKVPLGIFGRVLQAIQNDTGPDPEARGTSRAASRRTGR